MSQSCEQVDLLQFSDSQSTVNCPPEDIIKHFSVSIYPISLCSCLFTIESEAAVILEKVGGHKVYVAEAHLFYRKCHT